MKKSLLDSPAPFALTGVALAAALILISAPVQALGLGRVLVQSSLGEPLRADIDITSLSAEESSSLRVALASAEAYRAAGVGYNPSVANTEVSLQQRADGRPYLRLSSQRVVQEPFLDLILELQWATGRLVREYTLLLDLPANRNGQSAQPLPLTPPVFSAAPALLPVTPPPAPVPGSRPAPPVAPPPPSVLPAPAPANAVAPPRPARPPVPAPASRLAPQSAAAAASAASAAASAAPATAEADDAERYRVRQGDTLWRIASRQNRPGVSLDQMLVSLYRANPQAFSGGNMNRLRSGVVLSVPSAGVAGGVPAGEARDTIQAQAADFDAYRRRLAGLAPLAAGTTPSRQASGQVQAQVDDRKQAAAPPTPDKLTLSKEAAGSKAAADEAKLSAQRARNDADTRLAELSKNVEELRQLSRSAAASEAASGAAAVAMPASTPASVPASVAEAPAAASAVTVAGLGAAADPASVPASAGVPLGGVLPPLNAGSAMPPVAVASSASEAASAAPETETASPGGLMPWLLEDNRLALALGGVLVALLAGVAIYRFAQRSRQDVEETSFLESRLQPESFFMASGGEQVDTQAAQPSSANSRYSLSQLDGIGDVDPVAEADVYLAYGRDLQAEEILKEALRTSPERLAIRTKLLEVYAKRRDTRGFEVLASQLFGLTGGQGEAWQQAQEMGRQIDPDNPMYGAGGAPVTELGDLPPGDEPLGPVTRPQADFPPLTRQAGIISTLPPLTLPPLTLPPTLSPTLAPPLTRSGPATGNDLSDIDLDLDLDLGGSPSVFPPAPTTPETVVPTQLMPVEVVADGPVAPLLAAQDGLDADATLMAPPAKPAPAAELEMAPLSFDLSSISLDLADSPAPAASSAPAPAPVAPPTPPAPVAAGNGDLPDLVFDEEPMPADAADDLSDPLARKLELAEEFRQIGDMEGARDLLQEVVDKASGPLQAKAQAQLDALE